MKRIFMLLYVAAIIFALASCAKSIRRIPTGIENLAGYIIIDGDTLILDEVEVITSEDKDRISELGLTQQGDMPDGYYIYRLNKEKIAFQITDETIYTFVDFNLLFISDADGDRLYTTKKKEEFIMHLEESYHDTPPAQNVPFFIETQNGQVISITEKFMFTI